MEGRRLRNLENPAANFQNLEKDLNDLTRACINTQERIGKVRRRAGSTQY